MPSCTGAKAELRRRLRTYAASFPEAWRAESDRALVTAFLSLPQVAAADTLFLYRGMGSEPDTLPLMEALWAGGKTVLLPKCLPHRAMEARQVTSAAQLMPGTLGIPEPGEDCPAAERDKIDLILVPGLCFDRDRNRLGQGGGYYDRFLAGYGGLTVALCRDAVLVDRVPVEPHDRPVDLVLTETRRFSRGSLS